MNEIHRSMKFLEFDNIMANVYIQDIETNRKL
jgi:hypothetical protein